MSTCVNILDIYTAISDVVFEHFSTNDTKIIEKIVNTIIIFVSDDDTEIVLYISQVFNKDIFDNKQDNVRNRRQVIITLFQYLFDKHKSKSFHKFMKTIKNVVSFTFNSCLFASEDLVLILSKIMNSKRILNCTFNMNILRSFMKKLRVVQRDESDNIVANYYIVN
jgi:hypothetical protein